MAEYDVQLLSAVYITGTVYGIEAESMEAAKAAALARHAEASWPVDDTGSAIVPEPDRIVVDYVRNTDTDEEEYTDEAPPTRAGDAAGKMLAALRDALDMLPAMMPHWPGFEATMRRYDAIRAAIAAAEAAGITAEGR